MRRALLISLVTVLVFSGASAQAQNWIPVGPEGGSVRALASDPRDPRRIYLGTADGILYRSDDGGRNWRRLSPGFPLRGCSLDDIVVDPHGVVLVGFWEVRGKGGGVARSTDGGLHFTVLKGVSSESVRALAVAPSDPLVIAAGTLTGAFLSRDGGSKWVRITPRAHPDLRNIGSLAFDPNDPQVLYAGTWHLGWKTLDGGVTWAPVHKGMIDDSDVMTLTTDRRDPQTIYATACSGIYRSTDGAVEWSKLRGIPYSSRRTRAFSQGSDDPNLLLAGTTEGLWISEDAGAAWRLVTPNDLVINALLVLPDDTILLGSEGSGVLRSSDRGRTWAATNTGFSERFPSRLLFDVRGGRLFVAEWGRSREGGVFACSGVGKPWVGMGKGLERRQVLSLAVLGETIVAGTDEGVFALAPDATSWAPLPTVLDGKKVLPRVTELIALTDREVVAATSQGVFRSTDAGRSWSRPPLERIEEVLALAASSRDPKLIVAATPSGIFRSIDGGGTWKRASSELRYVKTHAMAFAPSDDRILFAATSRGLFRSGDHGTTWRRVNGGVPHSDISGIVVHPDGHTLYASDFTWGGIYQSVDGGSKWNRMPTDGLASDRVWTMCLDPAEPRRLLAGSSAGGLHMLRVGPVATTDAVAP